MARARDVDVERNLVRFLSIRSSYSPSFSHDGRRLSYVSDSTGVPQVWSIEIEGGSPQQLTYYEDRVGLVSNARKGDSVIFAKDHGGDERFQLFLMGLGGAELEQLTNAQDVIHEFGDWSPSDDSILFSSNKRNRAFFDVYTLDLSSRRETLVHRSDSTNYGVGWSPDGKSVLVQRVHAPFDQDLFLFGPKGDGRCLTEHEGDVSFWGARFAPSGREVYVITDAGREFASLAVLGIDSPNPHFLMDSKWDVEGLAVSDDGKRFAFTTNVDGASRLSVWEPPGAPGTVAMPTGVVTRLKWSRAGDQLAFAFSGPNHNQDIWLHSLGDGTTRRLTRSSASGIDLAQCPTPKLGSFASFDKLRVPYYLYRPRGSMGPSPTVVFIHGGPESQAQAAFSPVVQFLLSVGLSVAVPNVRGSTGYGRTYTHLDDVERRMDSVADIERLVAHLRKSKVIDPSRLAVFGGSYGGFMVLACMYEYPDLWAAGVDIVGISNFVTFLKNTGPWRRKLRAAEYGDPESDREFLERISPTNNVAKITAPLFMIHGTNDPRVPIGETKQMANELKKLGRTAEVMVFEDEGHGLVKLRNRITGYSAAAQFLLGYLGEEGRGTRSGPSK